MEKQLEFPFIREMNIADGTICEYCAFCMEGECTQWGEEVAKDHSCGYWERA